jgi:hypothetical protein
VRSERERRNSFGCGGRANGDFLSHAFLITRSNQPERSRALHNLKQTAFNGPFQHLSSASRASISMVSHPYISQKPPSIP